METLTVTVNTSGVQDFIDSHVISDRMHKALSLGVRKSLAITQKIHKTEVVGRGIGPWGDAWSVRTGEATRSFHIAQDAGAIEGAYGSELKRIGVLELGTQVALGGPLKSSRGPGKYLAIPTERARVGKGRAVSPRDWPEDSLVFARSHKGNPLLLDPRTGEVMFVLRSSVTIKPHPTLARTQERAQPKVDAAMLDAVDKGISPTTGYL
jgi:hypothetical protein